MRKIWLPLALALLAAALPAFSEGLTLGVVGAYSPSNLAGYQEDGFAPIDYGLVEGGAGQRDLGSDIGGFEAKASLSWLTKIPVLAGTGPMTEGNNLALEGSLELSPVSINLVGQATLTPIAFLNFQAGAGIGTGWSMGFLGLAINPADSLAELEEEPFGGAVWRVWGAATFQFDLAALMPGDWNHVVMVASPKIEYRAYSAAADGEAWLWEADSGENFNGMRLYGTFLLGYQMPLALNTVGILVETDEWLGEVRERETMDSAGGWGSDFRTIVFGPLCNFVLSEGQSLAVLAQFKVSRDYSDASTLNRYFEERDFEDHYVYFSRIALSYSLAL